MIQSRITKKKHKQNGFTILEIMISLTILATMVSILLTIFADGVSQASEGESSVQAMIFAQSKMDEILIVDATKLDSFPKSGKFEGTNYTYQIDMSQQPYHGTKRDSVSLKHILLTVLWDDGDGEREVSLEALRWTPGVKRQ